MKKEFNLDDYHTGKYDVVTRNRHKVRILATDVKHKKPIVCAVTEEDDSEFVFQTTTTGRFFSDNNNNSDYDLFLVSKTEKLYIVHFIDYRDKGIKGLERYRVKRYVTKEDADRFVKHRNKDPHYKFIRIEEVEVDNELLKD